MDDYEKNIKAFNTQLNEEGLSGFDLDRLARFKPARIVIIGMGGSGIAGDVISTTAQELNLRAKIEVWKDYGLPPSPIKIERTLFIFCSFSGNTEETLSGFKTIFKKKDPNRRIAAIATGGELEKLARQHHVPLVTFRPDTLTPRQSAGSMFYSLIKILRSSGHILQSKSFTHLNPQHYKTKGKALADQLQKRVILIYTDQEYGVAGYIWKIKCNETAKMLAFANVLPEMNHNEIVSFDKLTYPAAALFIHDTRHPRLQKKFSITEALAKKQGVKTFNIKLTGQSRLENIWEMTMLADWTTYFLARYNSVDPKETKIIDTLKSLMKKAG
mgnify:CR=1 FL=1